MSHIQTSLKKYASKLVNKKLILLLITMLVFLVPFVFWAGDVQVGGDDSKLYYQYPQEYLNNFTTKIISENQLGSMGNYFDQSYISPFIVSIYIVKQVLPFVKTQLFFYALNLSLSFFFFYQLLIVLQKSIKIKTNFTITILSSLLYSFSAFTYFTVWFHQLFAVYLVSFVPLVLFLFIRSLIFDRFYEILLIGILSYIFSFTLLSIPWIASLVIAVMPLLIYMAWTYKTRFFKNIVLLLVVVALVNSRWLFHFIYAPLVSSSAATDVVSMATSQEMRTANENSINAVSRGNTILSVWRNVFHENIQIDFNWNTWIVFAQFYRYLSIPNAVFTLIILFSLLTDAGKKQKNILLILAIGWLLSSYFFTVRIGDWGLRFFVYLNNVLPGFTMFRNMYDKFGIAVALSFGLLISFAAHAIYNHFLKKNYLKQIFLLGFSGLVVFNIYPFVKGKLFEVSYASIPNIYNKNDSFSPEFYEITNKLDDMDLSSRVLWWPLNSSNYTIVRSTKNSNEYYIGVSPLMILKGIPDFNGFLSFPGNISDKIYQSLADKDYQQLLELFQQLNINYIVVNKNISPEIQRSYLFSKYGSGDLYDLQMAQIDMENLVGDLIIENDSYALYEIKKEYQSQKINFEFNKVASYKYEFKIQQDITDAKLIFLDSFHSQWNIYDKSMNLIPTQKKSVNGYAMEFEVPETLQKDQKYYLYFAPDTYNDWLWWLQHISLGVIIILLIITILSQYKEKQ